MAADHPMLRQTAGQIEKKQMLPAQRRAFDTWRQKQAEGSELRAEADALWAQIEKEGLGLEAPAGAARAIAGPPGPQPLERKRPFGGGGRPQGSGPASGRTPAASAPGGGPPRPPQASHASPSVLGQPFHNPYTFLKFGTPTRRAPSPLSIDEEERDRLTGVIDVELELLSPLLTCNPVPVSDRDGHKTYAVLASGDDAILPSTGVRGALRSLLTVLTGGTLGYLDDAAWLCQGRDLPLGPRGKTGDAPRNVFLAEVVEPGAFGRSGTVRLGKTAVEYAETMRVRDDERPARGKRQARKEWNGSLVKLSGRPIKKERKREGLFDPRALGPELVLEAEMWVAYLGRHRHAEFPELKKGDLVWLEARDPECTRIEKAEDVASIQWARWGRRGERLLDVVRARHPAVVPDALREDGKVDEVTDLFGQVPLVPGAAGPFAARVRPENLVFEGEAKQVSRVALAPLSPPHPGCSPFYRQGDATSVRNQDLPLRGYKIYRTTRERAPAPWRWETQGVHDRGRLKPAQQKVNKTCDLVREGARGQLRISFRALTQRELALLLATCSVDWRLGGGKPLGLGHARVRRAKVRGEDGGTLHELQRTSEALAELPSALRESVGDLRPRLEAWQATQQPVERLRYPRGGNANREGTQVGGHAWFQRSAARSKQSAGLQPIRLRGELAARFGSTSISGQLLPVFDPSNPLGDILYGYDMVLLDGEQQRNGETWFGGMEVFQPDTPQPPRSGGAPRAHDRDSRQEARKKR